MEINKIICGDTKAELEKMPNNYVDTIVTSCPYWGLRDYGEETKTIWDGDKSCKHKWTKDVALHDNLRPSKVSKKTIVGSNKNLKFRTGKKVKSDFCSKCGAWYGQLGLEPTLDLYIKHLLQITLELKRVLKKTGVMFWNHGDCYGGSGQGAQTGYGDYKRKNIIGSMKEAVTKSLQPKCLAFQNYRLILRMIDEQGWILRNDIKWHKPNSMPSSVKDRFSNSYEPVFMLVKQSKPQYYYNTKTGLMADKKPTKLKENIDWFWKIHDSCQGKGCSNKRCVNGKVKESYWHSLNYWFDLDAVRVPWTDKREADIQRALDNHPGYQGKYGKGYNAEHRDILPGQGIKGQPVGDPMRGKNPGDLWTIPTQPFPEAHFATFPEKLIEPMILAACPEWICKNCGKARVRITKTKSYITRPTKGRDSQKQKQKPEFSAGLARTGGHVAADHQTIGWTDCGCNAGWRPGITLDPFGGAGTTGVQAKKLERSYIIIDIKAEYCEMSRKRILNTQRRLL